MAGLTQLSGTWLERLPEDGWFDLADGLDAFPELRDAVLPIAYTLTEVEGVVAGHAEESYLEAAIAGRIDPVGVASPDDDQRGIVELSLDTATDELRLSTLDMPAVARGAGLGSAVLLQLVRLADDLGLASIHLQAGKVGRWAWMRCGFDFDDEIWRAAAVDAAKEFAGRLGRPVDLDRIEHSWDFLDFVDPVSAEEIRAAGGPVIDSGGASVRLGKALLLGPSPAANPWWGRLDLAADSPGRVRLEQYVRERAEVHETPRPTDD